MRELPLKDDALRAAIDYLEQQGYSVGKWYDFEADDESTWPNTEYDYEFVTNQGVLAFNGNWLTIETDSYGMSTPVEGVTYWQPVPSLPERLSRTIKEKA